ncbi:MAG: sugar porter family MFS transporter [Rothia sp. (in: high G+C Gram-positive bacteria)]|uniref:sugar porter family MFS transporter n=1 Tax=Rothia sp. (in: high G+C Gram-positive bacteria) TaxID=1885016 RepID=UPI0026DF3651|nr:sugar porter family MFS transporter [Rothia sp. (in: high G+C Gram-positive bacteria)]MDO5750456.1 sugar porter family MFS transporter [Rothia sp. (in: high G+C Gram-positive bacteria)]
MTTTLPAVLTPRSRAHLARITLIATLGGVLFGYDTGVINGTLGSMSRELGLDAASQGVVTGSLGLAAAAGALAGGRLSDAYGRRKTILGLSVLFIAGALLCVIAPSFGVLVAGRIVLGLAVGGASTVVPVYLAEIAPYEVRGSLAGRNELMVVAGQLAAFIINAVIGTCLADTPGVWRLMFAVCVLPAVGLLLGMMRVPESPRWLVSTGRIDQARQVMASIRDEQRAEREIVQILETVNRADTEPGLRAALRHSWFLPLLAVGIAVSAGQQLTGINAIMYYGTSVLEQAGFSESAALIANIGPGVIGVLGSILSLRLMERVPRRVMVITGYSLTALFHALIGVASLVIPEDAPYRPFVLLALIIAFVGSMQTCLNVSTWVILSELFPLRVRAAGMGFSALCGWGMNSAVGAFFPVLLAALGLTGAFFAFMAVNIVIAVIMARFLPETRGVSLEDLEQRLTRA